MNISTLRSGISPRAVVRAGALLSALPLAFLGYSTVAVAAARADVRRSLGHQDRDLSLGAPGSRYVAP
jgi:hypothetical protein